MREIKYKPIGVIHSPFKRVEGMPIQPPGALGVRGTVEVFEEYSAGLKDIGGFSHIILIYHFHLSKGFSLEAKPFMDDEVRGVFSMRGPARPNPIGISAVRLVEVEGCTLHIEDIDVVDGTPLLDIKPYVPDFDGPQAERIGWLSEKSRHVRQIRSDRRFAPEGDKHCT
jgi:tRNA-Thr(GGU) m(6)t(6)A37 methyltransferase TsaA